MTQSQIVGIIPARLASTRFPKKMLADIFGKSLIQRSYENAARSTRLTDLIIATDDPFLFTHITSFGGRVVLTSPDCPTGSDRVAEAAKNHFPHAEIIVNIQGDEPCLNPQIIDDLVDALLEKKEAMVTTPVSPIHLPEFEKNPSVVKCVFDQRGRALYFSRAQIPFPRSEKNQSYRHIGVYAYRYGCLTKFTTLSPTPFQLAEDIEALKILEHGLPLYVIIVEDQAIGVDNPEDLEVIKKLLCQENIYSLQAASSPL